MATISKEALQWMQDELESKDALIDSLEEELSAALEDRETDKQLIASQEAQITRLMSDRSTVI